MYSYSGKLGLAQMVRFLVVKLTHPDLNLRFNMSVAYLQLIILSVVCDVPVRSETLLMTDFVNLKIKSVQSFEYAHRDWVSVRVFIRMSACTYMSICIHTLFLI
jgi:hypothetical protein